MPCDIGIMLSKLSLDFNIREDEIFVDNLLKCFVGNKANTTVAITDLTLTLWSNHVWNHALYPMPFYWEKLKLLIKYLLPTLDTITIRLWNSPYGGYSNRCTPMPACIRFFRTLNNYSLNNHNLSINIYEY